MTSIFVSYSHHDEPRARVLIRGLRTAGHQVFWDEDIPTGADWANVLRDRVLAAQCVVVAWTPRSADSRYVRLEAQVALEHDALVPVLLEDVQIPGKFNHIQTCDLRDWIGNVLNPEWIRLLDHIRAYETRRQAAPKSEVVLFSEPTGGSELAPKAPDPTQLNSASPPNRLQELVETHIRAAFEVAPVQQDALRDITTIRVVGDQAFRDELRSLEQYGYQVVKQEPGEALLERRRRFNWTRAAILTLPFVLPALVYIVGHLWLPKMQRVYVVRTG